MKGRTAVFVFQINIDPIKSQKYSGTVSSVRFLVPLPATSVTLNHSSYHLRKLVHTHYIINSLIGQS